MGALFDNAMLRLEQITRERKRLNDALTLRNLEQGITMTNKDRKEFQQYLTQCTDRQVQGVYDKEKEAGRKGYAGLAKDEAERRGITLDL